MKVESSSFATFDASIEPTGGATITVALDSVDTLVDLRNVRMRFLFFETFIYPEATVRVQLTPEMVADLPARRRETLTVPFTFDLHGVEAQLEAPVTVTLLGDDQISIASAAPISIAASDFGLAENITKLENAVGGISVVPSATVTFDLLFQRRGTVTVPPAGSPAEPEQLQSVALESSGNFSSEECTGRFETLSRTGNIYFRTASARLQDDSYPLLKTVVDIVRRCPQLKVVIAGYTDSDGLPDSNRVLSEARARSVMDHLIAAGIDARQLTVVGYGEERPVAPNDTAYNKSLNRRIEFSAQHAS
jgi:OOP family OmpA-OmpF porin